MQLTDMPSMRHLSPIRTLTTYEQATMKNWVNDFGKCVRQRTVRQETTKFKVGTLPLNMYQQSDVQLGEKVMFNNIAHPIKEEILQQGNDTRETREETEAQEGEEIPEQVSEYDSEDEDEEPYDLIEEDNVLYNELRSSNQPVITALDFMRAV
ncbi:unnamed protein product [Mytilus coruscus]|uniref:Uncharacterized protein n=1 Tax=Mytilus coruscus TaxID=42192 RepID=A0A6J8A3W2_MYTCO|nr:unnamed protein product [Mytilus coruscus]